MMAMLALDFDGVICDALLECAAIIWYAAPGRDPGGSASMKELVAKVPQSFLGLFSTVRSHSRTLEDFTVALSPQAATITDQASFARVHDGMSAATRQSLAARATRIRAYWRTTDRTEWLDLHHVYEPVAELLRGRHETDIAVITAKDEDSVREILAHHGLEGAVHSVIGECSDKPTALAELARRRGSSMADVTFIDDNVDNARQVKAAGARTYWARWGYHTDEHVRRAEAERLAGLELDDVSRLDELLARPGRLATDRPAAAELATDPVAGATGNPLDPVAEPEAVPVTEPQAVPVAEPEAVPTPSRLPRPSPPWRAHVTWTRQLVGTGKSFSHFATQAQTT